MLTDSEQMPIDKAFPVLPLQGRSYISDSSGREGKIKQNSTRKIRLKVPEPLKNKAAKDFILFNSKCNPFHTALKNKGGRGSIYSTQGGKYAGK